jgi:mRNA interferase RelE/StbE
MPPARRSIKLPEETADLVRCLHPQLKRKIRAAFKIILDDPLSGKALKDELLGMRSFRVSKFRIIYRTTKQEVIEVIAVGPRKTIYEETLKLLLREK